ncbi:MAG: LAGLIDADG family homing endonuclease [Candidatus Woesebacteria bacterium]|nr:LAGLIDADG family homing endonuclease [Candidatus Woesebacteria bacterium]
MYTDPRGGHNRKHINKNFFRSWSPKMAYVAGFIYADGAIEDVRTSSRTCYLAIGINDKELLLDIRKSMSSNHNIYVEKEHWEKFPGNKRYLSRESYKLRVGSQALFNDLVNLGLTPRKSLTLKFPTVPDIYLGHFVRGYFDGDGCVNISYKQGSRTPILSTIFTCGSKDFLVSLSHLLENKISIKAGNVRFQSKAFRLRLRKNDSLKLLKYIYEDMDKSIYLRRKYDKYQRYLLEQNSIQTQIKINP